LAWFRDLEKIKGEGLSPGHAIHQFLKNIIDNDYKTSVTYCRNTGCSLDLCIVAMRKQERDIQQKKTDRQQMKATLRHMKNPQESDDEDSDDQNNKRQKISKTRRVASMSEKAENEKFKGELDTTEKGLLRFKGDCWKKMEEKEKYFVRDYNASIKHGDPIDKIIIPEGITIKTRPRRTRIKEEPEPEHKDKQNNKDQRRTKGVTFGITDDDHNPMEFDI
jgi:hypothetical protein